VLGRVKRLFKKLRRTYLLSLHFFRVLFLKLKGAKIGSNTWLLVDLKKQANIQPEKITIGNRCVICTRTMLLCGQAYDYLQKLNKGKKVQNDGITIKDNCFIGIGAIVMDGVSIGPNAIVGAGAVVMNDVKPNTCVAGNPARYVCDLDSYASISESTLIDGYKEILKKGMNKSEFLTNYFWNKS